MNVNAVPLPRAVGKRPENAQEVVQLARKRLVSTDKRVRRVFTVNEGKKKHHHHKVKPESTEAVCYHHCHVGCVNVDY